MKYYHNRELSASSNLTITNTATLHPFTGVNCKENRYLDPYKITDHEHWPEYYGVDRVRFYIPANSIQKTYPNATSDIVKIRPLSTYDTESRITMVDHIIIRTLMNDFVDNPGAGADMIIVFNVGLRTTLDIITTPSIIVNEDAIEDANKAWISWRRFRNKYRANAVESAPGGKSETTTTSGSILFGNRYMRDLHLNSEGIRVISFTVDEEELGKVNREKAEKEKLREASKRAKSYQPKKKKEKDEAELSELTDLMSK